MARETTAEDPHEPERPAEKASRRSGPDRSVPDTLAAQVEEVTRDEDFVALLHELIERDKEILDRLAE